MSSFSPLDLIAAHSWRRATFTTYAFSASFAEAVLVEALMRQGVAEITILTDPFGYRMALRERGAVRIGREYVVHPISVRSGCFHPKLMVLEADDATHVTIGSGNLTFGGWSANLECIEHLHTNGMSLAIDDVGAFFATLADSKACRHDARDYCRSLGQRLAAAASAGSDDGAVRVVSSLDQPIVDQVVAAANALGRAESLTMASPYWDAHAAETLLSLLGLREIRAHVHPARVPAPSNMDWPRGSSAIRPVEVAQFVEGDASSRGLHAKMTEVVCSQGRLVVAGSANATSAALLYGGETVRNVEVCTLRSDVRAGRRWKCVTAKAPPKPKVLLEEDDGDAMIGVLVATHVDGGIRGRVLSPWHATAATVTIEVNRRPIQLGPVSVVDGEFSIPFGQVEEELSLEGRIQLRLKADEDIAEGFVTAPNFSGIRSRAGKALVSMMAILKSLQTPEDVLAVMEYFRSNPEALRTRVAIRSNSDVRPDARPDPLVDPVLVGGASSAEETDGGNRAPPGKDELAWQKFVARLLQAFARTTVPTEDDEDETDRAEKARRRRADQAKEKLGLRFPQLFQKLSEYVESDVELVNLTRMTHFVCVTTSHPATESFLARLVALAGKLELGDVARDTFAWCIAYLAARGSQFDAATARGRMLTLGIDPDAAPKEDCALPGFLEVLAPEAEVTAVLEVIRSTRTVYDDVRALEVGLGANIVPEGLRALPFHEAWPRLLQQCAREPEKRRIRFVDRPVTACPQCNIALMAHLKSELSRKGICETSCHGFILVRKP